MQTERYTVKNTMVDSQNLDNHPTNFYPTQICEDQHNYASDKQQDQPLYNHNVIRKAFINVIFAERIHQVAFARVKDDAEYRAAEEKCSRVFSQLEESLTTEEQKKLFLDLEAAWHGMYGIFLEHCYCQGLADSKMIHKQLEKYGISVVKEDTERNYELTQLDSSVLM